MNTDSLEAFLITTQTGSVTRAAGLLGLTQSALSQKIMRLESELNATLFIRRPDGLGLTASGEKLLIHARQSLQLQEEFLKSFESTSEKLSGHLRIAGYSSIMRSLVMPRLAPWLREHPEIIIEFSIFEVSELESVLKSNRADMVLTDFSPHWPQVIQEIIGQEEFVLIESKKFKSPEIYLDHDALDNATESFFAHQGLRFNKPRRFVGDVYGLIDGVALGLGRAVLSKHLVEDDSRFKVIKSKKRYARPIILNYYEQSYYPVLHKLAREQLKGY